MNSSAGHHPGLSLHRGLRPFAALALVAVALLAACGGNGTTPRGAADSSESDAPLGTETDAAATGTETEASGPKWGGTLRYDTTLEVASWKPADLTPIRAGGDRGMFIYDTLLKLLPGGSVGPNMADIESDDGITWRMTLRDGIEFTDGTPLDAAAVVFNITEIMNPDNGSTLRRLVSDIKEMNILDSLTVEFVLGEPGGNFPEAFTTIPGMIASPTAYQADPDAFGQNPVGAGPFMVDSYVRDSTLRLVRNPNYWDQPKPYLDTVEFRILTDPLTRAQAVTARETDISANDAPVQAAVLRADSDDLKVFSTVESGALAVVTNHDRPPFDDIRIRQAISLAWDYDVVNESLLQGAWKDPSLVCPPFSPNQPDCLPGVWPGPDPAGARELVEEYVNDGNALGSYELVAPTSRVTEAQFIQQAVRDIGINAELTILAAPEFISRMVNGEFDLIFHLILPFDRIPADYYRYMASTGRHAQKGQPNLELDEAMNRAAKAISADERTEAARRVQEINAEELNYIFFGPPVHGIVGKSDVVLGDRYPGGALVVAQDIWLDR